MRSIRMRILRLFVVAGVIGALTVLAPTALAGSHRAFYLDKTCGPDASEPLGYVCVVQHSDFKWIPPGTKVHYAAIPPFDPDLVVAPTIGIANGSTTGVCLWSTPVNAVCTFDHGTGRLTQFHLVVVVTASADESVWYWNGSYWFGG